MVLRWYTKFSLFELNHLGKFQANRISFDSRVINERDPCCNKPWEYNANIGRDLLAKAKGMGQPQIFIDRGLTSEITRRGEGE